MTDENIIRYELSKQTDKELEYLLTKEKEIGSFRIKIIRLVIEERRKNDEQ